MFLKSDATIMEYLAKKMTEKVKKCGIDNIKFLPIKWVLLSVEIFFRVDWQFTYRTTRLASIINTLYKSS